MRRLLFVGIPFGPFFKELAAELERNGTRVWRVVVDGGDFLATPKKNRVMFHGTDETWEKFIKDILVRYSIDGVVTFNDCLPHERQTQLMAQKLGLLRYVIENGYLRPHWVTFDRNGVNGHSCLPRDIAFYRAANSPEKAHIEFPFTLRSLVATTVRHFVNAIILSPFLEFNTQYYGDSIWRQARGYMLETVRRRLNPEVSAQRRLDQSSKAGNPAFMCLLQKPGDAQLVRHSQFGSNLPYLEKVINSFASHAAKNAILVVKQHPLDYGQENCGAFAQNLATKLKIKDRVIFIRNTSIDIVFPWIRAVVTINSTAGFASVVKGLPVKCLGNAFYDMAGLTNQGELDHFWQHPIAPMPTDVAAFVNYLKATSQFNGGFETAAARKLLVPQMAQALVQDSLTHYTAKDAHVSPASVNRLKTAIVTDR